MMLMLIFDVFNYGIHTFWRYRKNPITILPVEISILFIDGFDPFG